MAETALRAQGKHSFNEADLFSAVLQQPDIVGAVRDKTRNMAHQAPKKNTRTPDKSVPEEDDLEQATVTPFKVEEWN